MDQEGDDRWETVAVAPGRTRAEILKGRLETEGIPVKLKYEAAGAIYGLTLDGLGEVDILVPSRLILRAHEILSQSFQEDELPWEKTEDEKMKR